MSHTLGCTHMHVTFDIRWRAAVAIAADVGEYTQAVDFPLQTAIAIQPRTARIVKDCA